MLKKSVIVVASSVLLLGCAVPMGGTGQTSSGEIITGETMLNASGENTVTISSLEGWSCSGNYSRSRATAIRQFPLVCDNGASGTATLSVNAPTADLSLQRATVAFRLSNGKTGTVQFGLLS